MKTVEKTAKNTAKETAKNSKETKADTAAQATKALAKLADIPGGKSTNPLRLTGGDILTLVARIDSQAGEILARLENDSHVTREVSRGLAQTLTIVGYDNKEVRQAVKDGLLTKGEFALLKKRQQLREALS